ncbi:MAG TPA: hypothetical protein VFD35_09545, partial [Pricia sp.]|nr:hypothetical protein [Pricia sp.]
IELMRAGFTTDGFEAYPVTRDLNKRGVPKDVPGPFPRSIIPSLVGTIHFSTYDPFTVPTDLVRINEISISPADKSIFRIIGKPRNPRGRSPIYKTRSDKNRCASQRGITHLGKIAMPPESAPPGLRPSGTPSSGRRKEPPAPKMGRTVHCRQRS